MFVIAYEIIGTIKIVAKADTEFANLELVKVCHRKIVNM